jgi:hypothetical protein
VDITEFMVTRMIRLRIMKKVSYLGFLSLIEARVEGLKPFQEPDVYCCESNDNEQKEHPGIVKAQ